MAKPQHRHSYAHIDKFLGSHDKWDIWAEPFSNGKKHLIHLVGHRGVIHASAYSLEDCGWQEGAILEAFKIGFAALEPDPSVSPYAR